MTEFAFLSQFLTTPTRAALSGDLISAIHALKTLSLGSRSLTAPRSAFAISTVACHVPCVSSGACFELIASFMRAKVRPLCRALTMTVSAATSRSEQISPTRCPPSGYPHGHTTGHPTTVPGDGDGDRRHDTLPTTAFPRTPISWSCSGTGRNALSRGRCAGLHNAAGFHVQRDIRARVEHTLAESA